MENPKRRELSKIAFVLVVTGAVAQAQQPAKVAKIGYLWFRSASDPVAGGRRSFERELRALGYVEAKNIAIEDRSAEGKLDRLPAVADELVESLARPRGNVTGLTNLSSELSGKRLELLKEAVPGVTRVAFLWTPLAAAAIVSLKTTQETANALRLQLQPLELKDSKDFDSAFKTVIKEHSRALVTTPGPIINSHQPRILQFAARNRLAAMYAAPEFTDAGGLMSYGLSYDDLYRRAAIFVDKILKGCRPADLPVEQPTKFEFVINLKGIQPAPSKKRLLHGLTIPPSVLYRADKVIR